MMPAMLRTILNCWKMRRYQSRGLFAYVVNGRVKALDPWRIVRALNEHPTLNLERDWPMIQAGQEPETSGFVKAAAEIFGFERLSPDGRGLTDGEAVVLMSAFVRYLLDLKKNTSPGPTSSAPTAGASSSTSPTPPGAGNSPLASGAVLTESIAVDPGTLAAASSSAWSGS